MLRCHAPIGQGLSAVSAAGSTQYVPISKALGDDWRVICENMRSGRVFEHTQSKVGNRSGHVGKRVISPSLGTAVSSCSILAQKTSSIRISQSVSEGDNGDIGNHADDQDEVIVYAVGLKGSQKSAPSEPYSPEGYYERSSCGRDGEQGTSQGYLRRAGHESVHYRGARKPGTGPQHS